MALCPTLWRRKKLRHEKLKSFTQNHSVQSCHRGCLLFWDNSEKKHFVFSGKRKNYENSGQLLLTSIFDQMASGILVSKSYCNKGPQTRCLKKQKLIVLFYFLDFIYLILERREGKERGREISMCGLPLLCPLLGTWSCNPGVTGRCSVHGATPARAGNLQ